MLYKTLRRFCIFSSFRVEILWKVMFKYRFFRIQTMSFIEIVHLSCKCDFSKTHLQHGAWIFFQPDPFRYTVESRIQKCSDSVIKSESHQQILVKKSNFPHYLQLSCKAISLAKCFSFFFSKVNLGGGHMAQTIEKTWF